MSLYSGKCDVFDHFGDYDDEKLSQCDIYADDNLVPLRINNQHDLAPYYPYIVVFSSGKDVYLSHESYVDTEERRCIKWRLEDIQKYYRKCKRNKIPYSIEEAIRQLCIFTQTEIDIKIAEIVGERGDKVTAEDLIEEYGIRCKMQEYYRKQLLDTMIELGWDERKARYWIWKDWKCLMTSEE